MSWEMKLVPSPRNFHPPPLPPLPVTLCGLGWKLGSFRGGARWGWRNIDWALPLKLHLSGLPLWVQGRRGSITLTYIPPENMSCPNTLIKKSGTETTLSALSLVGSLWLVSLDLSTYQGSVERV